jgi:hypothetical protein
MTTTQKRPIVAKPVSWGADICVDKYDFGTISDKTTCAMMTNFNAVAHCAGGGNYFVWDYSDNNCSCCTSAVTATDVNEYDDT